MKALLAVSYSVFLLASFGMSRFIYGARRDLPPSDRLLAALVPPAVFSLAVVLFYKGVIMIYDEQNWIRLSRTFALAYGFPIYSTPSGVVVTNIYGPVSALVYLPATFFHQPDQAVWAGSFISVVLYLFPVARVIMGGQNKKQIEPAFLTQLALIFGFTSLLFISLKKAMFTIHADAPALAFAALSGGFLYFLTDKNKEKGLFLSALFAVLSVWSKQVAVPLVLVLPLYLLFLEGRKVFFRYLFYLLAAGIPVSLFFLKFFGARELIWNMFTLPGAQPAQSLPWNELVKNNIKLQREFLFSAGIAFCAVVPLVADRKAKWGKWLRENRWLLFWAMGLAMAPVALLSLRKIGGANNTLSFSAYFFLTGAMLAFVEAAKRERQSWVRFFAKTVVTGFSLALILSCIPVAYCRVFKWDREPDYAKQAYEYIKAHPGNAYFPRLSLIHLLAEHKLYHCSDGVLDRKWASVPLSEEQFKAGIPPDPEYVGFYRRGGIYWDFLPFEHEKYDVISDPQPGLEAFLLYRRKPEFRAGALAKKASAMAKQIGDNPGKI